MPPTRAHRVAGGIFAAGNCPAAGHGRVLGGLGEAAIVRPGSAVLSVESVRCRRDGVSGWPTALASPVMKMDHAGQAESAAPGTALFDYVPDGADYAKALRWFALRTRPGLIGSLVLPLVVMIVALSAQALRWRLTGGAVIAAGSVCFIAVFFVRHGVRRSRVRGQYGTHAALGTCRTTLTDDGLTTTGSAGESGPSGWNVYPWWFETPDLFVLTGSAEYFFVLPKRGAASSADLDRARALFARRLRRI